MNQASLQSLRQLKPGGVLDDTKSPGAALESGDTLEDTLDNLASAIKQIKGTPGWEDLLSVSLEGLSSKKMAVETSNLYSLTISGGPLGVVVIPATLISGNIAVGGASNSEGGVIAAPQAGFVSAGTPVAGTSLVSDANGSILNIVDIFSASNNEVVEDGSGRPILGLIQCLNSATDNDAIGGATSENLQMSFVVFDTSADNYIAANLADGSYQFRGVKLNQSLSNMAKGALLGAGVDVTTLANVEQVKPFKVIRIGAGGIAAGVALNISTGAFASGSSSVISQNGAPVLPSNGNDFRDDSRYDFFRGGQKLLQGPGANGDIFIQLDVYYVSNTEVAFSDDLEQDELIFYRTPDSA